jgi:hypothetical protein
MANNGDTLFFTGLQPLQQQHKARLDFRRPFRALPGA